MLDVKIKMPNPLETIKKIKGKSWTEIRTRGEQAIVAQADQIGLSGKLPSDEDFVSLIDESFFGGEIVTPQNLFDKFYEDAEYNFFPSFRQKEQTLENFRTLFGEKAAEYYIEQANKIIEGKFDLLGYENLDFGAETDWHFEPIAGKTSPLKHWKQFDELSAEETGDKKIVWELNRHQYFFKLGAAFWLTGDEKYAEHFVNSLESWMEKNPPGNGINWFSSLEVAFRSISWIWSFNFFKESTNFTPEVFHKALKFIYLHARHIEKYLSTYYSPNTHLTGEGLGLYYIGTQFQFFKAAKNWRETGEKILYAELDRHILADGVYFEQSTWYQRYTSDFYTHFYILKTLSGDAADKDLQEKLEAKLQSSNDCLMAMTRPDGTTPLIGDDDGGRLLPAGNSRFEDFRAVLATGAVLFERGDYKFVAGDFAEESLWLLGGAGAHSFENLAAEAPQKKSFAFEAGGYFAMRDGWLETDDYLLIDCGELGALNGGHVLVDSGTDTYHESVEMRDYFRSTEAHNTLTIDGKSQSETNGKFSWKTKANARLKNWISQERFDFFEGSHDGYEKLSDAATHTRSVLFLKNDYWIMRDFVETSGRHDYKLNFHFDAATAPTIETGENGNSFVDETSAASEIGLRLFTFGDNGTWEKRESPISTAYGKKIDAPFLQYASRGTGAQEFFTFILPNETAGGSDAPQVFEVEVSGGRAFVINFRGYQDLFVFTDGEQTVRTEIFNTNFRFLWARLNDGETLPEEYVLIGGTNFSLDGREVINYPKHLDYATARRFGNKLNVHTSESIFSVSLPQKHSTTYILKRQE
jgi:hypothetical protein